MSALDAIEFAAVLLMTLGLFGLLLVCVIGFVLSELARAGKESGE